MSAPKSEPRAALVRAWQAYRRFPTDEGLNHLTWIALRLEAASLPPAGPDPVEIEVQGMFLAGDREAVPVR